MSQFKFMDWEGYFKDAPVSDLKYTLEDVPCSQDVHVLEDGEILLLDISQYTGCVVADKLNELAQKISEQEKLIDELYSFRLLYNALLFNEWCKHDEIEVYKSKKHSDGEICFDGNWFIVVAILPTGKQISNHYNIKDWDLFKIPEYPQMKDEFDGHTSQDVIDRLRELVVYEM